MSNSTPTKKAVSPWDISVTDSGNLGDGHSELSIGQTISDAFRYSEIPRRYELAEVVAASQWIAGISARVLVNFLEELDETRRNHRCQGRAEDPCGVYTGFLHDGGPNAMVDPADVLEYLIYGSIIVPTRSAPKWKTRIETLIAEIVANDRARPDDEDRLMWGRLAGSNADMVGVFETPAPAPTPEPSPIADPR